MKDNDEIQAVILAAGEGTRLRPLTGNRPKVMLPAANKPILSHVLNSVINAGIRDITVVVGYKKELVMEYLNRFGYDVKIAVQEKQLGTADALRCADEFIHTKTLIVSGDNYIDSQSIQQLSEKENAILVSSHEHPEFYGVISQQKGVLTDIIEKPDFVESGALVSCGAYVLSKKLIKKAAVCSMTELIKNIIESGEKIEIVNAENWQDASYPKDLLLMNSNLLKNTESVISGTADKTAVIRGHVKIGKNSVIGPNSVITGPVSIGDDCIIDSNVCIGPGTSIASRVKIEPFTYIENSIIMNDCAVGSHSRIADTVMSEGAVCFDHVSTISDEIGAVISDRATIGPFTILNGAKIGNNAKISGGRTIKEDIPDDAMVI
ncbi:MAG TPA: sugar phosphate nucleotidyltransferase [Methanocorpusculum sp.]|nr:sugar phosphate nucleotidyltransferase [Methanocorpusculum sp.]